MELSRIRPGRAASAAQGSAQYSTPDMPCPLSVSELHLCLEAGGAENELLRVPLTWSWTGVIATTDK